VTLNFEVTTYCNAKCYGCFRAHNEDHSLLNKHLKFELFEDFIYEKCYGEDLSCVLCGQLGDPILHPDIEDIIELCYLRFRKLTISTNGGNRNPNWYRKITNKYKKNIEFVFAIDGITQEVNEIYRKGVNFKKAFQNMISCPSRNVIWNYIIFKHNLHQMRQASIIAKKHNIKIRFMPDASI